MRINSLPLFFTHMFPIDPDEPFEASPNPPMAPPYVDDNLGLESVMRGLDAAEDDLRDTVTGLYEDAALNSEDPDEALDDILYPLDEESDLSPEVRAMHIESAPDDLDR